MKGLFRRSLTCGPFAEHKLEAMLQQNMIRTNFAQRLQQFIDTYNAGCSSHEHYFEELLRFIEELKAEDVRHIRVFHPTIDHILRKTLTASYDRALFKHKCDEVFDVILDYAVHGQKWAS